MNNLEVAKEVIREVAPSLVKYIFSENEITKSNILYCQSQMSDPNISLQEKRMHHETLTSLNSDASNESCIKTICFTALSITALIVCRKGSTKIF